jgi:hypothetical protein
MHKLKELEERLCRLPAWLDHGTHILIVAEPLQRIGRGRRTLEQRDAVDAQRRARALKRPAITEQATDRLAFQGIKLGESVAEG